MDELSPGHITIRCTPGSVPAWEGRQWIVIYTDGGRVARVVPDEYSGPNFGGWARCATLEAGPEVLFLPEPPAVAAILFGLVLLAALARRRR